MKLISESLGVARSQLTVRLNPNAQVERRRPALDDAALVEALGATVRVVPGDPRNLKITTPADLGLAEHLLRG